MRLYRIRIEIYEAATQYKYPVVTHIFTGKTPQEAEAYHQAHRRADAFLRQCEDKGVFHKEVRCRAVRREGWVGTR